MSWQRRLGRGAPGAERVRFGGLVRAEGGQRRGSGVQGHAAAMAGCGGISTRGRGRAPVEVALRRRGTRRTESDRVL